MGFQHIKVKAFPGSKKEGVIKKSTDSFEIAVKEKPERGLANKRVRQILADYFKVPQNSVVLIKGAKTRNKIFKINESK